MDLKELIIETEEILASFYSVKLLHTAIDFLLTTDLDHSQVSHEDQSKLALTVFEMSEDDLFIGIYFSKILQERLLAIKGTFSVAQISDIVCVFEEVSHFHHVMHAVQHRYQVSLMELEYLAELEKFSVLCEFFQRRFNSNFAETIFHIFFNQCSFLGNSDQGRYMAASKQARLKIQTIFSTPVPGQNPSPRHYRALFRQEYFRKMRAS